MTVTSATATIYGNVLLMLGPADPDGDSVYRALTAVEARSLSVELDDAADQLELAEGVSEQAPVDVTHGRWRITATYETRDNVTIYRDGEHYRTISYPSYKIWNLSAHIDEVVEQLERELAEAVSGDE